LWTKGLAVGIIMLFVGTYFVNNIKPVAADPTASLECLKQVWDSAG
jgi:hypothetical protein